jgi:hypothetical protein
VVTTARPPVGSQEDWGLSSRTAAIQAIVIRTEVLLLPVVYMVRASLGSILLAREIKLP